MKLLSRQFFYPPFFLLIILFLVTGCTTSSYKQTDEGVTIRISDANGIEAHSIRLQIIDDNIVHVSAIPGKRFQPKRA